MKKLLLIILINTFVPGFIISMETDRNELEQLYALSRKLIKENKFIQAKNCIEQAKNLKNLTTAEQVKLNDFMSRVYYNAATEYFQIAKNGDECFLISKTEKEIKAATEVMKCIQLSLKSGLDQRYHINARQMHNSIVNYIFDLGILFYRNGNIEKANLCLNSIFFEKNKLSKEKEQKLGKILQEINEWLKEMYKFDPSEI